MQKTIRDLRTTFPRAGRLEWIGVSPHRRAEIESVDSAMLVEGTGLEHDHHASGGDSVRQVTLIQHEHLAAVAAILGIDRVIPLQLRRNIVVSGINVLALKDQKFRIGDTILTGSGPCEPCSRMEENLGPGGYNAMRGHGGITARVLQGGTVAIGDAVQWLSSD